jgi:C-terminal processing protease CtpA/Prc
MHTKYWVAIFLATSLSTGAARAAEDSQAAIEAQLRVAQQELDKAAREVAELSTQLSRPVVDRLMLMGEGPSHAIIGVQLDDSRSTKDGAHIRGVSPGGAAAEAGMHAGDVIVSVNGTDLKASGTDMKGEHPSAEVARLLRNVAPNTKVKIHVLRDGKPMDFEVTARPMENAWSMPGMPQRPGMPSFEGLFPEGMGHTHGSVAGMELATLTPQLGAYFGTDKGVLVLRAPHNAVFNLEDGDVILSIDGREPTSGSHATRILASYQAGEKVKLQVMRQRKKMNLEATVPDRRSAEALIREANREQSREDSREQREDRREEKREEGHDD